MVVQAVEFVKSVRRRMEDRFPFGPGYHASIERLNTFEPPGSGVWFMQARMVPRQRAIHPIAIPLQITLEIAHQFLGKGFAAPGMNSKTTSLPGRPATHR